MFKTVLLLDLLELCTRFGFFWIFSKRAPSCTEICRGCHIFFLWELPHT